MKLFKNIMLVMAIVMILSAFAACSPTGDGGNGTTTPPGSTNYAYSITFNIKVIDASNKTVYSVEEYKYESNDAPTAWTLLSDYAYMTFDEEDNMAPQFDEDGGLISFGTLKTSNDFVDGEGNTQSTFWIISINGKELANFNPATTVLGSDESHFTTENNKRVINISYSLEYPGSDE